MRTRCRPAPAPAPRSAPRRLAGYLSVGPGHRAPGACAGSPRRTPGARCGRVRRSPLVCPRLEQGWPTGPRPQASRGARQPRAAPRGSEAFVFAWWRLRTRCESLVPPIIFTHRPARVHPLAPDHSLLCLEERRHRAMPLHPAEFGLGSQQTRRAPTPTHVAVTPPRHTSRYPSCDAQRTFDRIGRRQGPPQRSGHTQSHHRQRLLQALPKARRRVRVQPVQPPRRPLSSRSKESRISRLFPGGPVRVSDRLFLCPGRRFA